MLISKFVIPISSKNYSNFDPFNLTGDNGGTESWRLPDYGLMSAHLDIGFI